MPNISWDNKHFCCELRPKRLVGAVKVSHLFVWGWLCQQFHHPPKWLTYLFSGFILQLASTRTIFLQQEIFQFASTYHARGQDSFACPGKVEIRYIGLCNVHLLKGGHTKNPWLITHRAMFKFVSKKIFVLCLLVKNVSTVYNSNLGVITKSHKKLSQTWIGLVGTSHLIKHTILSIWASSDLRFL